MKSSMACLSPVKDFGVAMLTMDAMFRMSGSTKLVVVGNVLVERTGSQRIKAYHK